MDAFHSPNLGSLVELGVYASSHFKKSNSNTANSGAFNFSSELESNIAIVYIHPFITEEAFIGQIQSAKGVVLDSYGMGNFPVDQTSMMAALEKVVKSGIPVIVISQCSNGQVAAEYEAGTLLGKIGVILGGDMTLECTLTKLSYLLAKVSEKI